MDMRCISGFDMKGIVMKKNGLSIRILFSICLIGIFLTGCAKEKTVPELETIEKDNYFISTDENYKELVKQIDDYCKEYMSGSICVATDDQILYTAGFKVKESDGETLVGPFTTYEIGSVTKQFTAAAILQLVEKGTISLEETIDKYFPSYPQGKRITIDNLLHMRSGIKDFVNDTRSYFGTDVMRELAEGKRSVDSLTEYDDEKILEGLYPLPLLFAPNNGYAYSNTNYFLLTLILENVTGMTYEDYFKQNIFDICDMKDTCAGETGNIKAVPANNIGYLPANFAKGSGDIHSTVIDMLKWDRALMSGKVISDEQLEYMCKAKPVNKNLGYGCGMKTYKDFLYYHDGGTLSFVSSNNIFYDSEGRHIYLITLSTEYPVNPETDYLVNAIKEFLGK